MRLKRAIVAVLAFSALAGCAAEPDRTEPTAAVSSTPSTPTAPPTTTPTLADGPPIDPFVFCGALLADKVLPSWEKSSYRLDMALWSTKGWHGPAFECAIVPGDRSEAVAAATGGYSRSRHTITPEAVPSVLSGVPEFKEGREPTAFLERVESGDLDTEFDCQHADGCQDGITGYIYDYVFEASTVGALVEITITIGTTDRSGGKRAEYQQPAIDAFVAYMKTITAQLT